MYRSDSEVSPGLNMIGGEKNWKTCEFKMVTQERMENFKVRWLNIRKKL